MDQAPPQRQKLTFLSLQDYIVRTKQLLKAQQQYQIDLFQSITKDKTITQIQASGFGLSNMLIVSSKRGYYGKTVLSITKAYHSEKKPFILPEQCKIQVGDDVAIYKNNSVIADGVVSKRQGPKLQVSTRKQLDQQHDLQGVNCNIIIKWNQVTFNRYFKVLGQIQQSQSHLLHIFFPSHPQPSAKSSKSKQTYQNKKLNDKQNEAVERCLQEQVFLLHGPPGTGKTTTVCQVIVQAVKRGSKVLACGPSNISVDNIVEGLSGRVKCIRIGNPARIIDSVLQRCLDNQIAISSGAWKGQVKKLQSARKKLSRGGTKQQRRTLINEIKQLKDQIYHLQEQVIQQILQDASVLCCTNVGAADRIFNRYLSKQTFDLVVIDQCGQALQVSCWIPLLKGRKVLLAGDHKQLPPTVQGDDHSLLSHTLFTRAMEQLNHIPSIMLQIQYRMNNLIMGWSNEQFYQNKLQAHDSVQKHTLMQLCSGVKPQQESLLFVDTAGCGMGEQGTQNQSKMNIGQADLVIAIYRKLISCGVLSKYIAILTPYSKQVALIKSLVGERELPMVDVSTVDGIQGRQKQCIIISMVRSNSKRQIGFLKDWRRMNVAVTRARRMLILVGNVQCVTADKYIQALAVWVEQHGHISSAQQWRDDQNVRFGLGASDKIEKHNKIQKLNSIKEDQVKPKKKKKKKDKNQSKQEQKQHTEEQQAEVKSHFRKVFQQMARQLTISNATAFQRKMIHEVAEELGICHQTSEDKKWIKVWRKMTNDQVTEKYAQLQQIKMQKDLAEQIKMEKKRKKKQKQLQRKNRQKVQKKTNNKFGVFGSFEQPSSEEEQQEQKEPQALKKVIEEKVEEKLKKKKKKKDKEKEQKEEEQDIEALMRQYNASQPKQDQCYQCSKKISTVTRVQCKYCQIYYCRQHVLAQEHGCGEVAKQEARKNKPSKLQLEKAANNLQEQIKKQEEKRRKKGKEEKK